MEIKKSTSIRIFLNNLLVLLLTVVGVFFISYFQSKNYLVCLKNCVISAAGMLLLDYSIRQSIVFGEMQFDNDKHIGRFYVGLLTSLIIVFICVFIPADGWPILPIFLYLSLFSNPLCGGLAGITLVVILTELSLESIEIAAIYILCGIFTVILFRHIKEELKVVGKLFLTMLCQIICQMANIYLMANYRPSVEIFVIPIINVIISSILIWGMLKYFSSNVLYKYRGDYLDLNDVESHYLSELKKNNKEEYMHCIHTEYFCDRIANTLNLNVECLKCVGYYHKIVAKDKNLIDEINFPPEAKSILREYVSKNIVSKQAAVLLYCDSVIHAIQYMIKHNEDKDKKIVIESVFKHLEEKNVLKNCEITIAEINTVKKIFLEEKLYYDFLY